jgi:glycosyltransferase involved in cell wall biosynthesis
VETILVDSGSTDKTLNIAKSFNCNIVHINKDDFSFGRSLNMGCDAANGEFLIFISGHCIPLDNKWIKNIIKPFSDENIAYTYGKQVGNSLNKFSEHQVFEKFYPDKSAIPQEGFFCNNANSALRKSTWLGVRFDEELTGLEDMDLAKRLLSDGLMIAYVAEASVVHIHEENWIRIRLRYEREAIALQKIMPEVHVNFVDASRYFFNSLYYDFIVAFQEQCLWRNLSNIFMFRLMQYWGTYRGNHEHRKLSRQIKENYFYPK